MPWYAGGSSNRRRKARRKIFLAHAANVARHQQNRDYEFIGEKSMATIQSELTVMVKAKDLCSYVLTVTEKSPKRFRFTLVAKLQSYALNTIENLCRANEVYVKPGNAAAMACTAAGHGRFGASRKQR